MATEMMTDLMKALNDCYPVEAYKKHYLKMTGSQIHLI